MSFCDYHRRDETWRLAALHSCRASDSCFEFAFSVWQITTLRLKQARSKGIRSGIGKLVPGAVKGPHVRVVGDEPLCNGKVCVHMLHLLRRFTPQAL